MVLKTDNLTSSVCNVRYAFCLSLQTFYFPEPNYAISDIPELRAVIAGTRLQKSWTDTGPTYPTPIRLISINGSPSCYYFQINNVNYPEYRKPEMFLKSGYQRQTYLHTMNAIYKLSVFGLLKQLFQ